MSGRDREELRRLIREKERLGKRIYFSVGGKEVDVGDLEYMISVCTDGVVKPYIETARLQNVAILYQIARILEYLKQRFVEKAKEIGVYNYDFMYMEYILRTLHPDRYASLIKRPEDAIRLFASIKLCLDDWEMCVFKVILDNLEFQASELDESSRKRLLALINLFRDAITGNCINVANINIVVQGIDRLVSFVRKMILEQAATGVERGGEEESEGEEREGRERLW